VKFLCKTCGTQFADSGGKPPESCPICEDERQYVPVEGQQWTTLAEVRSAHAAEIREEEPGLTGLGLDPEFAIGQRALLVETPAGNVLWDCTVLLDAHAQFVGERGGISAIAVSHPHFYTTMVEWADAFSCPILVHEADRDWVMRPDAAIELWTGDVRELSPALTLLRLGGHFPGAQVLLWHDGASGRGALLTGDVVAPRPGGSWVSFMYSFPMLIPLPARVVAQIAATLDRWQFDRIYGGWWGSLVSADGKAVVRRSADRYVRAIS
jgi:glyoxylase-like metal-dependent hydrolase (beta-lactamase superfamily II)